MHRSEKMSVDDNCSVCVKNATFIHINLKGNCIKCLCLCVNKYLFFLNTNL